MYLHNIRELTVLPKLISVAQLDIGVFFMIVMVEGDKIEILVVGEGIGPAPVAPVAITHDHNAGRVVK
jgi:hypothetical protein